MTRTMPTKTAVLLLVAGFVVGRAVVAAVEVPSFVVVRAPRSHPISHVDINCPLDYHLLQQQWYSRSGGTSRVMAKSTTWDHQWALSFSSFVDDSNIFVKGNHENNDEATNPELPLPPLPPHNGSWLVMMMSRARDKIQSILESVLRLVRPLQDRFGHRFVGFLRRRSSNPNPNKQIEEDPHPPLVGPENDIHTVIKPHDRDNDLEEPTYNKVHHHHPLGRSAYAASHVDLSGSWKPVVTPQFQRDYDDFLKNCSQSYLLRQVMIRGIHYQVEHVHQLQNGRELKIVSTNPAGQWHRTLVASDDNGIDSPFNVTIVDPDGDPIQVEAWWEHHGTKHRSWLRGKPNLYGGFIETIRYLQQEDDDADDNSTNIKNNPPRTFLMCESTFHPHPQAPPSKNFHPGHVVWTYQRV
jgi:hypothetical protein